MCVCWILSSDLHIIVTEMLKHTPEGHQQKESLENAVRQLKTVVR